MIEEIEKVLRDKFINNPNSDIRHWDTYTYNGMPVPRVSDILSKTIHEDYLLGWANSLGFRHKNYKDEQEKACCTGTHTHEFIEDYLRHGTVITDFSDFVEPYKFTIYNAYNSFMAWWKMMHDNGHELKVLAIEKRLTCPFVGGTLDLLLEIDGRKFIVDFKTSNHMTYKYFLQLAAYQYMIEGYEGIEIDGGVFVLWLDKKQIRYIDYVLDFTIADHVAMINHCKETFVSLLYAYYNLGKAKDMYQSTFKGIIV